MSPNDMYAHGIAVAGAIPVPDEEIYCELLPLTWRKVHSYGVEIDHLIYDGNGLNNARGNKSPYRSGVHRRQRLQDYKLEVLMLLDMYADLSHPADQARRQLLPKMVTSSSATCRGSRRGTVAAELAG